VLGPRLLFSLRSGAISCSGITIGGTAAIAGCLELMAERIRVLPWRICRQIGHGFDQAIHHYLVHLAPEVAGIVVENDRRIATMALEPRASYRLDRESLIHLPTIICSRSAAIAFRISSRRWKRDLPPPRRKRGTPE
jgi:hypothetical protein